MVKHVGRRDLVLRWCNEGVHLDKRGWVHVGWINGAVSRWARVSRGGVKQGRMAWACVGEAGMGFPCEEVRDEGT